MVRKKILLVDDSETSLLMSRMILSKANYDIVVAKNGADGVDRAVAERPDLVLLDLRLPDINGIEVLKRVREIDKNLPVLIFTAYGSIDTAIAAIRLGAYDYLNKPFDLDTMLLSVRQALEASHLKKEVAFLRTRETVRFGIHRVIGDSAIMKELRQRIKQIAQSEASTVLLEGESGTGKDLVARTIHTESNRSSYPFVEVNCSAFQETLIESELFGHERGAFTDAKVRKSGLLELANRGTLYLDEIGDMNPSLQAKLIKVIEERTFRKR